MHCARWFSLTFLIAVLCGCSGDNAKKAESPPKPPVTYFKVDPATAGTLKGRVQFKGRKAPEREIDMDQDPECARLHKGGHVSDESIVVGSNGSLANVFVYVKSGLEGKTFAPPEAPVTIDQNGCWFKPRVLGIQTGQTLKVTNSDPVTHNIHPLAQINREWNHSQSQSDPPLTRRFVRQEIMIPVKCNIHHWMRAYIGAVEHPYFAVTGADGVFEINNLPPGDYTVAAWQEKLGTQEQHAAVAPSATADVAFTFKGE
jgi:plastocyanin